MTDTMLLTFAVPDVPSPSAVLNVCLVAFLFATFPIDNFPRRMQLSIFLYKQSLPKKLFEFTSYGKHGARSPVRVSEGERE